MLCWLCLWIGGFSVCVWAEPEPAWRFPDFHVRGVVGIPEPAGATLLVELPLSGTARLDLKKRGQSVAVIRGGGTLPSRLVHADHEKASVLVGTGAGRQVQEALVYLGTGKAEDPNKPVLTDPRPVRFDLFSTEGKSLPHTWEKMAHLRAHAARMGEARFLPGFGEVRVFEDDEPKRRKKRRARPWIVVFRTYVHVPEEGVHRVALDGKGVAYALVDGELRAARSSRYAPAGWLAGKPVLLEEGVHRVEVYVCSLPPFLLRLGWQRPGSDETEEVGKPFLLTARKAERVRMERADRTLHPDFDVEIMDPYAFRDTDPVFVPVRLRNASATWTGKDMTCRWSLVSSSGKGVGLGAGPEVTPVLKGLDEHRVRLTVEDALGFESRCERVVDCRRRPITWYRVAAGVAGLPAVCYAHDRLMPVLNVRATTPGSTGVTAAWTVVRCGRQPEHFSKHVTPKGEMVSLPMPEADAGELASLEWRVSHKGRTLRRGTIIVEHPPFTVCPVRVTADRLYGAQGRRLVLVPAYGSEGVQAQAPITTAQAFGDLVCVDDMLSVPGLPVTRRDADVFDVLAKIVDGPDRPVVRYEPLPDRQANADTCGALAKLVQVPALLKGDPAPDVAILSIGLRDLVARRRPEDVELDMAALCDMAAGLLECPLILVTPPPYPGNEGRVRPFAAAIRRAADARGIPVADLFTGFSGMGRPAASLFDDGLALTERGRELAAEIVARTLLSE